MDIEQVENELYETKRIQRLGFMNIAHWEEFKFLSVAGLIKFGDPFLRKLGEALQLADNDNAIKIIRYWQQECEQHQLLYKMYLAKENANVTSQTGCNK